MQKIITDNLDKIIELCRAHHVSRVSAFGSAVRDDFDPERSDVDFMIEFEPLPHPASWQNKLALEESLVRLLGRPVDLIREGSIDNPYLIREIESDRQQLYAA